MNALILLLHLSGVYMISSSTERQMQTEQITTYAPVEALGSVKQIK